jgi:RHS repeat-associated protein
VIVADQIGTPTALFDTDGAQRWTCDATLWGRARTARDLIRARSEDEPAGDQPSCALRFPEQREDAESGLHYNLNRYYDPDTGQYLSPDPIGVDGGIRGAGQFTAILLYGWRSYRPLAPSITSAVPAMRRRNVSNGRAISCCRSKPIRTIPCCTGAKVIVMSPAIGASV